MREHLRCAMVAGNSKNADAFFSRLTSRSVRFVAPKSDRMFLLRVSIKPFFPPLSALWSGAFAGRLEYQLVSDYDKTDPIGSRQCKRTRSPDIFSYYTVDGGLIGIKMSSEYLLPGIGAGLHVVDLGDLHDDR